MTKITALEVQKKNPRRVNIYLDGEFAFALARITAAWLKVGDELNPDKILQLQDREAREQAWQQAAFFLSFRPRSESEIRQNLRKHKISEPVIEHTLERLRQTRLAGDGDFARAWVENRTTFRPRGRRALESELRLKGLDQTTIQAALADVDEDSLAYQAALRKALRFQGLDWLEFRKKLSDFLARRGFPYAVLAPVVKSVWDEMQSQEKISEDKDLT